MQRAKDKRAWRKQFKNALEQQLPFLHHTWHNLEKPEEHTARKSTSYMNLVWIRPSTVTEISAIIKAQCEVESAVVSGNITNPCDICTVEPGIIDVPAGTRLLPPPQTPGFCLWWQISSSLQSSNSPSLAVELWILTSQEPNVNIIG